MKDDKEDTKNECFQRFGFCDALLSLGMISYSG